MSFERIPERMVGYATAELVEKLMPLTHNQRVAIDRIVEHHYIANRPMAELFRGEDRICREDGYYRRGIIDEETGGWKKRPGWHHDPAFQAALKEAVRLALTARTREELTAWAEAKRRARLAAGDVVGELVAIATGYELQRDRRGRTVIDPATGKPAVAARGSEDKDRIAAGKALLDYGATGLESAEQAPADNPEDDWWKAAEGEGS